MKNSVAPSTYSMTNGRISDDRRSLFGTRVRFVMVLVILLCLTTIWSNVLTFNFAVICMEAPRISANGSSVHQQFLDNETTSGRVSFSGTEQSWLTTVVAVAALLANFPVVALVNHFGIRSVFTSLGFLSAAATCLIPAAIRAGYYYFLALRFIQGIAFAANFPVIGAFCSRWAYIKQNGWFMSCLVAYVQLAPAITMPISGALCQMAGWPSVFYGHGVISFIVFAAYMLFFRNNPSKHPMMSNAEFRKISLGKPALHKRDLKKIPYQAILKTPAVWAVWLAAIGNFTCVNMLFLFSPIYINKVLGLQVQQTGISAAFGPLAQFCTKISAGLISDKIKFINETNKLRIFNTIAFFGAATALITLSFTKTTNNLLCLFLVGATAGMLGVATGGFFKAAPIISKQYSHFVTGNISLGITVTMLFVPIAMHLIAPENQPYQWSWIFRATAVVLIVANIVFTVFGHGEPCEWTTEEYVIRHSTRSVPSIHVTVPEKHAT